MTDNEKELPTTSQNNVESNKASAKTVVESIENVVNHEMEPVKEKSDVSEQTRKGSGDFQVKNIVNAVKEKATEAFHFVAGGEGDNKGLVGTVKEKAAGAFNYVAEKVTVATHAVTGDTNKEKIEKPTATTETEEKKT